VKFSVRDAQPGDYAAIARITVDVFIGEGYVERDAAEHLRDIDSRAAVTTLLVAQTVSEPLVVGAVSLAPAGSAYSQIGRGREAELRMLVVDSAWRGRGVGEALVRACLERARSGGVAAVVLSTQPLMLASQRLYERLSFRRTPERDWRMRHGKEMLTYVREPLD
jgi:ribosomal protein S18 acetylase RimI-like enzyme